MVVEERTSRNSGVFEKVLSNQEDITTTFSYSFGWSEGEERTMLQFDRKIIGRIRSVMAKARDIQNMEAIAGPYLDEATALLNSGQVAAIDGTNALASVDYLTTSRFACAVAWLSRTMRGKPAIHITKTASEYVSRELPDDANLSALCRTLDDARESSSWPTTFREYKEREIALKQCDAEWIFIDGPIFTQNLMTQKPGRVLYDRMLASSKHFIGIIKNLSGSYALTRLCSAAIGSGEVYIVGPVGAEYQRRLSSGNELTAWLTRDIFKPYIRVVFRPFQKVFAFECHRQDFEMACALITSDASKTLNHELPLLLETVDSQLRAGFNASEARGININRMLQHPGADFIQDYRDAVDVEDERNYR